MLETKCDVLIVGAGPAGCSAAFFAKLLDKNNSHEIILLRGGIRPGMVAGRMAAEALLTDNPRVYAEKWKRSAFASPLFLHAFDRLTGMNNNELARHTAPFRKGFNAFSGVKAVLFYHNYLPLYKAYDLSNKVGW